LGVTAFGQQQLDGGGGGGAAVATDLGRWQLEIGGNDLWKQTV
jgi:hypothetical protein